MSAWQRMQYAASWTSLCCIPVVVESCWAGGEELKLYQLIRQWRRSVCGHWSSLSSPADDYSKQGMRGHSSKKGETETQQPRATPHQQNPKAHGLISSWDISTTPLNNMVYKSPLTVDNCVIIKQKICFCHWITLTMFEYCLKFKCLK